MCKLILLMALCGLCGLAAAQNVYKCTVDGKASYSDTPCAHGPSTLLAVPDAPAADPRHQHDLRRDQALSAKLEKQRHARDAKFEREQGREDKAAAARKVKCDKLRLHKKWADEDLARAAGPATEPLKLKARRRAEAMALECRG